MPAYYKKFFTLTNPLVMDTLFLEIGLRRGAVLDQRIAEIPTAKWETYVNDCIEELSSDHLKRLSEIMDEVYLGMSDDHYIYFRRRANERLEAENEMLRKQEADAAAKVEMKSIIQSLEKKVDDLVGAGMLDEANMVLEEIQKYTAMLT